MSKRIEEAATDAVEALSKRIKDLERELSNAHSILDSYDIPRYKKCDEYIELYTLKERIKLYSNNHSLEILSLAQAALFKD